MEINHCREGRIEFESLEGEFLYIKKGDMVVNIKTGVKEYSYFSESHYSGVTIEIDFAVIETNPNVMLEELHLTPQFLLKLIIYFFARIHNQCFFHWKSIQPRKNRLISMQYKYIKVCIACTFSNQ